MYSPKHYQEQRMDLVLEVVENESFATVLTEGRTEQITHLPMQLVRNPDGTFEFLSHCARANPHWKELAEVGRVKLIFNGPHAYVSPAWYVPAPDDVPTWNYAVVHAVGDFEIINDPVAVASEMNTFVTHFENAAGTGWKLPANEQAVLGMMRAIVVFRIKNVSFEAKFKMSQKEEPANRANTIAELNKNPLTAPLAELMKKVML